MLKRIFHVVILIVSFALFDALVGGGVAAAMQARGVWIQTVNDFYQLGFSIGMAVVLLIAYFAFEWKSEALAVLVLLFGYVEDTLYYVLVPQVNPLIKLISHGAQYHASGGEMFPSHISGWLGWLGRAVGTDPISLSMLTILAVNVFAIVVAGAILVYSNASSRLK